MKNFCSVNFLYSRKFLSFRLKRGLARNTNQKLHILSTNFYMAYGLGKKFSQHQKNIHRKKFSQDHKNSHSKKKNSHGKRKKNSRSTIKFSQQKKKRKKNSQQKDFHDDKVSQQSKKSLAGKKAKK